MRAGLEQNNGVAGNIEPAYNILKQEFLPQLQPSFEKIMKPSRIIYTAKASREERNRGLEGFEEKITKITNQYEMPRDDGSMRKLAKKQNNHPTVKPLKLMEYLCELTKTPTGGIVLDPFCGSGTTLMAAKRTKRKWIGIEKEKEYCDIAIARIKATQEPLL